MKKIFTLLLVVVGSTTLLMQTLSAKTIAFGNQKLEALVKSNQNKDVTPLQQKQLSKIQTLKQAGIAKSASVYTHSLDSTLTYDTNDEITGKDLFTYNSAGKLTIFMTAFVDIESGNWLGIPMYFYYDLNGNNTLIKSARFDAQKNEWFETTKAEFIYDASGNVISETYSYKDTTGVWAIDYKFTSTYDAQGNILTQDYYDWSYYSNAIVLMGQFKYEYKFDEHNNLTRKDSYEWDKPNNDWVSSGIDSTEYKYNNEGKILKEIGYQTIFGTLVPMYNYDYSYDASGNRTQEISYLWDYYTLTWTPFTKMNKTFETSFQLSQTMLPSIYTDNYDELIQSTENYEWAINANDWAMKYTTTSFYGSNKTALDTQKELNATVRYNSANKTLVVNGLENYNNVDIAIYNGQGKLVFIKKITTNSQSENVAMLPQGMYFYKLTTNGKSSSGKFVK
ncbi:MAG: hypothetical protein AUK44_10340 [Porphyromonadaceae bacterium CG2_30_38_12]|nr:MAG: hypothetical protein AUK44_10340 [Porphyromonadaceae bacterium CG2_30_38_12]